MCLIDKVENNDAPVGLTEWSDMPGFDGKPFTDVEMKKALADVFNGEIDPYNLPIDTYNKTGEILTRGAVLGVSNEQLLGLGMVPNQLFFDALQDNAFKFAAAKTLDEVRKLSDALVDEKGNVRNWSDYRKKAFSIVENHRDNWLKAEYNNATSSAQMASKWEDLTNDDDFPYLKYVTAGDGRVRGEHARLNGTTLPKEHTFWSNFYPPNGWNCRCTVIKMSDLMEEYGERVTPQSKIPRIEQPDEFNINVGTHRVLFSPENKYFAVGKQFKSVLDALPKPGAVGGAERVKIEKVVKPSGRSIIVDNIKKNALKLDVEQLEKKGVLKLMSPTAKQKSYDINTNFDIKTKASDDFTVIKKKEVTVAKNKKQAIENEKKWVESLSESEKSTVFEYTTNTFIDINGSLRGREGFEFLKEIPEFNKMVDNLSNILRKAPKFETNSTRGMWFDDKNKFDEFVKTTKKGGVFYEKGFMSTSANKIEESRFTDARFNVKMQIEGKNGVLVTELNTNPDDVEILFNKGTKFEIKEVSKSGNAEEWGWETLNLKLKEID